MSVGYPADKTQIDSKAGALVVQVRDALRQCSEFCAWLQNSAQADANLIGKGYTQAEVTALKAAFTDLGGTGSSLYRIAHGQASVASPNDFFFNALPLAGVA